MEQDPTALRSLAIADVQGSDWHVLEPVIIALEGRGFDFGTPKEKAGTWRCEYGPFQLVFARRENDWSVSMPIADDNVVTRALLKTLDEALRALPGVQRVEWYKREAPAGPPAASPFQP